MIGREPCAGFDFVRMQRERAFVVAAVYPDVFHAGFGRGSQFEEPYQWSCEGNSEFLAQFAHGASIVVFAAIEMTRRRRIPCARKAIFLQGALLQKDFAARIKDEDVNGAVLQGKA